MIFDSVKVEICLQNMSSKRITANSNESRISNDVSSK